MIVKECPVCDSKHIEIIEKVKKIFVPMAEPAEQKVVVCHCEECGSDIRVSSDSQEEVERKIKEKADESMPSLIAKINAAGISDARMERALDLAPHTVYRWKQGKQISATVLALARYIASQPKLIDFAEEGFADSDCKIDVCSNIDENPLIDIDYAALSRMYQTNQKEYKCADNEIYYNPYSCFGMSNGENVALCN